MQINVVHEYVNSISSRHGMTVASHPSRKRNVRKTRLMSFRIASKDCLIRRHISRVWHSSPVYPGKHLHSSGLSQYPCWQPGSGWHARHVGPAQPRRQRHSPGDSQKPRVAWQSERQIAGSGKLRLDKPSIKSLKM